MFKEKTLIIVNSTGIFCKHFLNCAFLYILFSYIKYFVIISNKMKCISYTYFFRTSYLFFIIFPENFPFYLNKFVQQNYAQTVLEARKLWEICNKILYNNSMHVNLFGIFLLITFLRITWIVSFYKEDLWFMGFLSLKPFQKSLNSWLYFPPGKCIWSRFY